MPAVAVNTTLGGPCAVSRHITASVGDDIPVHAPEQNCAISVNQTPAGVVCHSYDSDRESDVHVT